MILKIINSGLKKYEKIFNFHPFVRMHTFH